MNIISISGLSALRIVQSTYAYSKISAGCLASLGVAIEDIHRTSILVDGVHGFATVVVDLEVDANDEWDLLVGSDIGKEYDEMFRSRNTGAFILTNVDPY